jgi:hypothetical protein
VGWLSLVIIVSFDLHNHSVDRALGRLLHIATWRGFWRCPEPAFPFGDDGGGLITQGTNLLFLTSDHLCLALRSIEQRGHNRRRPIGF